MGAEVPIHTQLNEFRKWCLKSSDEKFERVIRVEGVESSPMKRFRSPDEQEAHVKREAANQAAFKAAQDAEKKPKVEFVKIDPTKAQTIGEWVASGNNPDAYSVTLHDEKGPTGNKPPPPSPKPKKLLTDGPTLSQFVKSGYPAENYPPSGYSDKRTPKELADAKTQADAKVKADADEKAKLESEAKAAQDDKNK